MRRWLCCFMRCLTRSSSVSAWRKLHRFPYEQTPSKGEVKIDWSDNVGPYRTDETFCMGAFCTLDVCTHTATRPRHEQTDTFRHICMRQSPWNVDRFPTYSVACWIWCHKVAQELTLIEAADVETRSFSSFECFLVRQFCFKCIHYSTNYLVGLAAVLLGAAWQWAARVGCLRW